MISWLAQQHQNHAKRKFYTTLAKFEQKIIFFFYFHGDSIFSFPVFTAEICLNIFFDKISTINSAAERRNTHLD